MLKRTTARGPDHNLSVKVESQKLQDDDGFKRFSIDTLIENQFSQTFDSSRRPNDNNLACGLILKKVKDRVQQLATTSPAWTPIIDTSKLRLLASPSSLLSASPFNTNFRQIKTLLSTDPTPLMPRKESKLLVKDLGIFKTAGSKLISDSLDTHKLRSTLASFS